MRRSLAAVLLAVTAIAAVACTGPSVASSAPASTVTASIPPVVRDVLAAGEPRAALGQNLELVRYTIQPGTSLPAHRHPGLQIAYIESGELDYSVVEGTVTVHAPDGTTRTIGAGESGTILPGEWIAEGEDTVHFGENAGAEPLVILASSLLDADQPPAVPVPTPS